MVLFTIGRSYFIYSVRVELAPHILSRAVVLKLFSKSIIHSIKIITLTRKLPKNRNKNFQKWFLKYNFKNSKCIKNIEVWSLRTPGLDGLRNIKSQICSVKSEEIIKV